MLKKRQFLSIRQLLFVGFVTVVLSYIFLLGIQNIFSYYTLFTSYQNLHQRHAKELDRNLAFKSFMEFSQHDEFWKSKIRSDLGYVMSTEKVFRFYKDD